MDIRERCPVDDVALSQLHAAAFAETPAWWRGASGWSGTAGWCAFTAEHGHRAHPVVTVQPS